MFHIVLIDKRKKGACVITTYGPLKILLTYNCAFMRSMVNDMGANS